MKKTIATCIAICSLFFASNGLASSVFIQKKDGSIIPEVLPKDACAVHFERNILKENRIEWFYFPINDGLVIERLNNHSDFHWNVKSKDEPQQIGISIRPHFHEKGRTGMRPGFPETALKNEELAKAIAKAYEKPLEPCLGYISSKEHTFLGVPLQDVDKITFYSKDDVARDAINKNNREIEAKTKEFADMISKWRKNLKRGTETHCGLVVEINHPIARLQTAIGEVWLKIEQLYPQQVKDCRFVNGVYQQ